MTPLTVPATIDSLRPISDYVLRAAGLAGLDARRTYRLRLAVDEIATNIVAHGVAGEVIAVDVEVGDDVLTVSLEDDGAPFDPRTVPRPDHLDAPLDERPIGGLGIYLATRSVDGFTYERIGDRNRNVFTMQRVASTSA